MSLTVENGTGLDDAESYVSAADFRTYCAGRGYDLGSLADAALEQKLRLATSYLDTICRFKGNRLRASQMLEWPRSQCFDWSGYEVTGLPARVVRACNELAFAATSGALYENLDRGGRVKSESVGPISVTYADDAPVGRVFRAAMKLIEPFMRDPAELGVPLFTLPDAGPAFSLTDGDPPGEDCP